MREKIILSSLTIEELAQAINELIKLKQSENSYRDDDKLLTREETCKFLSINKTTLWKHTKSGRFKSYGVGNRVFYKKQELIESINPLNH